MQLRFDAAHNAALPAAVSRRLVRLAGERMTQDGVIVLTANQFGSQQQNRRDARERLTDLIRRTAIAPKRRRPSRAARQHRLDAKRRRGAVKAGRGRVRGSD